MSLDENVSAFIGRLYESAYDQKRWDECAKELMRLTNAHFFFYSTVDTRNPAFNAGSAFGADDSRMASGFQEYFAGH